MVKARRFGPGGTVLYEPQWTAVQASKDTSWSFGLFVPFEDVGLTQPPLPGTAWRVNVQVSSDQAEAPPWVVWGVPDLEQVTHGVLLSFDAPATGE